MQTLDVWGSSCVSVIVVAMPMFTPLVANGGRQNDVATGLSSLTSWFVLRLLALPVQAPSS